MRARACRQKGVAARRGEHGLGYVEVLVATLLVALALVPALESFQHGAGALYAAESRTVDRHRLASRMEELLALRFEVLETMAQSSPGPSDPLPPSDPPGTPSRRLVFAFGYDADDADGDGDRFTGVDPGLVWLRVAIENSTLALETLADAD